MVDVQRKTCKEIVQFDIKVGFLRAPNTKSQAEERLFHDLEGDNNFAAYAHRQVLACL